MLDVWLTAELPSSDAVRRQYRGSLDMSCFLQIASVPLCELRDLRRGVAVVGYLNRTFRAFRLQLSSANDAAFG